MYEVDQIGSEDFEIIDRTIDRMVAETRTRDYADRVAHALNYIDIVEPLAMNDMPRLMAALRESGKRVGNDQIAMAVSKQRSDTASAIESAAQAIERGQTTATKLQAALEAAENRRPPERIAGDMIIAELHRQGFAAEWEGAPTGAIDVPMPGGWLLVVGTASGTGWGWILVDPQGDGHSGNESAAEIGGALLAASPTEQAGLVVREVRRRHALRTIDDVSQRIAGDLGKMLAAAFPAAVTGDIDPHAVGQVEVAAERFARAWVMANVPGAASLIR